MMLFAKIISLLSNPAIVLMPAPYLLVEKTTRNGAYALEWTAISIAFIGLLALFIFSGVLLGVFSDFDVSKKEQRPLLFTLCVALLIIYGLTVLMLQGPKILLIAAFGLAFSIGVLSLINKRIKASIHVATISVFLFLTGIAYGTFFLILAIFLVPLIAWSRVKIKRHTVSEVLVGGFLGVLLTLISYIISRYLAF